MAPDTSTEGEVRVLCVDDDPMYISTLAGKLQVEDDRFSVATANNVPEAMSTLEEMDVDCVIADYDMPGRNGVDFAATVDGREDPPPVFLLTSKEIREVREHVAGSAVRDVFFKSSDTVYADLAAAVLRAAGGPD